MGQKSCDAVAYSGDVLDAKSLPWGDAVVSDLSLGIWMPSAIARDLSHQLAITLPEVFHIPPRGFSSQIAAFVDAETTGDVTLILASRFADLIGAEMNSHKKSVLIIVCPIVPSLLGRDNVSFIDYLRARVPGLRVVLLFYTNLFIDILGSNSFAPLFAFQESEHITVRVGAYASIPGVIPHDLAIQIGERELRGARTLDNGVLLLPACCRMQLEQAAAGLPIYRLSNQSISIAVQLYHEYNSSNPQLDILQQIAWHSLFNGSWDLANKIMLRCRSASVGSKYEWLYVVQHQGMRIAFECFDDVVSEAEVPDNIEPQLAGYLTLARAWGLLMCGRPRLAEPLFDVCRRVLPKFVDAEGYCWILNISALNRLRLGDLKGALDIELVIRRQIESKKLSPQLNYINGLNLGRLYRRLNDFERATASFDRAFATTAGCASAGDHVLREYSSYQNLLARHSYSEAFWALVRSALYWLASEVPEALPARAVRIITHSKGVTRNVEASVAGVFIDRIMAFAREEGFDWLTYELWGETQQLDFCMTATDGVEVPLIFGDERMSGCVLRGGSRRRFRHCGGGLSALLTYIMKRGLPKIIADEFEHTESIGIDDRFGLGMALTRTDLLATAIRLNAQRIAFASQYVHITTNAVKKFMVLGRLHLGNSVESWDYNDDKYIIRFRRYREDLALNERESVVFGLAIAGSYLRGLKEGISAVSTARVLESRGVVNFGWEDAATAGFFSEAKACG